MTITVGGSTVNAFNVEYSKGISEVGSSGVSVSQLSFDTTANLTGVATAAEVTCSSMFCKFYINTRTRQGSITHVEALDAAAFLDQVPVYENADISRDLDGNKYIGAGVISSKCASMCKGLSPSVPWAPTSYGFPLELVEGKSFLQILTELSEVMCGFYTIDSIGNYLTFKYMNNLQGGVITYSVRNHSAVNVSGTFQYNTIRVVTGFEDAVIGYTEVSDFNVLTIDNSLSEYVFPMVTETETDPTTGKSIKKTVPNTHTIPEYMRGVTGVTFTGWSCNNAVLPDVPALGDTLAFAGGGSYRVTDMQIRFIGNTLLASVSGGIPTGGEIARRSRSQIKQSAAIDSDTQNGNVLHAKYQGDIYLAEG